MAHRGPQAGITNRPPNHLLLAALAFRERTPAAAGAAVAALGAVVQHELRSELDDPNPPDQKDVPSRETGELGFDDHYDRAHLTITLGISATGADALGIGADDRPADLRPIPWSALGDAPDNADSGDLVLQVCSDDLYICEHVVRRIEQELGGQLAVAWTQLGTQRYSSRPGRTSRREGRALIGFLDGTANLHPRNSPEDAELVFVDPDKVSDYPLNPPATGGGQYGPANFPGDLAPVPQREPDWTRDGTYMVVRTSTFDTTPWDDLTQNQQEQSIGRFKVTGASLDLSDDRSQLEAEPAFATNQADVRVRVDAHMRKANPRRDTDDAKRRIFRRGYPLIGDASGGMRRGLVFIAFARSIAPQFEFIVRAWLRNENFPQPGSGPDAMFAQLGEHVVGGGYYFCPPLAERTKPWTWVLPPAG